jgi:hypothetical protein
MDIQLRKINFIQEFLKLSDEKAIEKLEKLLQNEKAKLYSRQIKPYTTEQFNQMIDKAEEDSEHNRIMSSSELKNNIKSWG